MNSIQFESHSGRETNSHTINLSLVAATTGGLLAILGALMFLSGAVDIGQSDSRWSVFAISGALSGYLGIALWLTGRFSGPVNLGIRDVFFLTTVSWTVSCFVAAVPLYFSIPGISFSAAMFEVTSGLTATGATVLTNLDEMPRSILLWRGFLQWYGGVGIVVLGMAILPALQIGGMQLFRTESSDQSEKLLPRAGNIAIVILAAYVSLTIACAVSYSVLGMSNFDAVVHAMTTVATGGFSTHDASIGFFHSLAIDWTAIIFMISGALPFGIYIGMLRSNFSPALNDPQIRLFLILIVVFSAAVFFSVFNSRGSADLSWTLTEAVFLVVSIFTTTGFAASDYTYWGHFNDALVFLISFIGGCSGSTSGGLKVWRLKIVATSTLRLLRQIGTPHAMFPIRYRGQDLDDKVIGAIYTFLFLYFMTFLAGALVLSVQGYDGRTAMSASISAVGNVGPALGPVVGPAGTYSTLPSFSHWTLVVLMLLGRLELMTVFVLFLRAFWRR